MGFDQVHVRRGSTESKNALFAGAARHVINDNMKRRGDKALLKEVLEEIEMISAKRMKEGLNQWNFSFGVFNCFFLVYIFGECQLLYLYEYVYLCAAS